MHNNTKDIRTALAAGVKAVKEVRENTQPTLNVKEVGVVTTVLNGVVRVEGLPNVGFEEVVNFENGSTGLAFDLAERDLGVILFGDSTLVTAGMTVQRTQRVADVPVGDGLLGRVIDPQGRPLDAKGPVEYSERMPIERPAPPIMSRDPVATPLQTGIKVIDALIPVGHGQRELILGDRQTGKTAIALDAIINQKGKNVICIYCAIGQRSAAVAKAIHELAEKGAMAYTIVMVAEGQESPGLRYIAPYAATSIAEWFMLQGHKTLVIYDDLTNHARAYRELSLLLRRPPGREAFPGDIFYVHARLLERATHLRHDLGGGSLTALPIIETQAQDMSAYIPTNLISITDGQIYLNPDLFEKGILPAVDVGKSVSRVGGKAQLPAFREVTGNLKLSYAQFEELEAFAKFGTQLDPETRRVLEHGKRIRWCLNQNRLEPLDVQVQIFVLLAFTEGLLDDIPLEKLAKADELLRHKAKDLPIALRQPIISGEKMTQEMKGSILSLAKEVLAPLQET